MGTNRRYADSIDRRAEVAANERLMQAGTPLTLTKKELQLEEYPLTRTPKPLPVRAWVRYGDTGIEVAARVVAWTSRAVAIEWDVGDGKHRAWVWASAVDRGDG